MDCRLPGSSVHGVFQARILEWVAISSSRGSSQPRDPTRISCIGRQILYHRATWEARDKTYKQVKLLNVHFCTVEAVFHMFCISMNFLTVARAKYNVCSALMLCFHSFSKFTLNTFSGTVLVGKKICPWHTELLVGRER